VQPATVEIRRFMVATTIVFLENPQELGYQSSCVQHCADVEIRR
jgi:hypothetical protein